MGHKRAHFLLTQVRPDWLLESERVSQISLSLLGEDERVPNSPADAASGVTGGSKGGGSRAGRKRRGVSTISANSRSGGLRVGRLGVGDGDGTGHHVGDGGREGVGGIGDGSTGSKRRVEVTTSPTAMQPKSASFALRSRFPRLVSHFPLVRLSLVFHPEEKRGGGGATYHARCLRRWALLMFWWLSLAETVKARAAAARRSETARILDEGRGGWEVAEER